MIDMPTNRWALSGLHPTLLGLYVALITSVFGIALHGHHQRGGGFVMSVPAYAHAQGLMRPQRDMGSRSSALFRFSARSGRVVATSNKKSV